jgi:transcriptional regulator EpsA
MTDNSLVILSRLEEEYLVRSLEAALQVRDLRHFFLWTQGQFQGLLPHEIMVCIQFSQNGETQHVECLRSTVNSPQLIKMLCAPEEGLAVRLANHCRAQRLLPAVIARGARNTHPSVAPFQAEIESCQLGNAVVHGTGRLRGGGTFFALFSLPEPPTTRQAFFLDLLLPSLHLAFLRVATQGDESAADDAAGAATMPTPLLTGREIEVLRWVTKGKSNYEIGMILVLSTLTIKNHMQRIYKKLNVHNRAQAVSRSHSLRLLDTITPEGNAEEIPEE